MPMDLVSLGIMVLFVTSVTAELYVWRAEYIWGQPISMGVWQSGDTCLSVTKRAASSNSAVEDMMNLMICERVRSRPLLAGMGTSSERNMWDPIWLRALISLRKNTWRLQTDRKSV